MSQQLGGARVVSIKASIVSHATENEGRVVTAILNLCPEGFPRKMNTVRAKGHYGNEMVISRIEVKGVAKAEAFFSHLWSRLPLAERREIQSRIEGFMDRRGALHIRVDKQASLSGRVSLRNSDPIKLE